MSSGYRGCADILLSLLDPVGTLDRPGGEKVIAYARSVRLSVLHVRQGASVRTVDTRPVWEGTPTAHV